MRDRHDKIVKLCSEFPLSIAVIAKALGVHRDTINRNVDYLICKGRIKNISINPRIMILSAC